MRIIKSKAKFILSFTLAHRVYLHSLLNSLNLVRTYTQRRYNYFIIYNYKYFFDNKTWSVIYNLKNLYSAYKITESSRFSYNKALLNGKRNVHTILARKCSQIFKQRNYFILQKHLLALEYRQCVLNLWIALYNRSFVP